LREVIGGRAGLAGYFAYNLVLEIERNKAISREKVADWLKSWGKGKEKNAPR
jgi:hypothetical protein